jgi:hypothetical protein
MNFVACTGTPSGSISVSGSELLCEGEPIVLTAPAGTNYQWIKDGEVISGATSATYSPETPGDYSVTINSGECPTAAVTINPAPVATVTADANTISSGESVTISAYVPSTVEYYIPLENLLNLNGDCGNGSWLGAANQGFQWTDTESSTPVNINIQFSVGVECHNSQTHTTSLNGNAGPSYAQTPYY